MPSDHITHDTCSHPCDPSSSVSQICAFLKDTLAASGALGYVVGISGGLDSAVVATLLVRSVGADQVTGLFLPSPTTPKKDYGDVASLGSWLRVPIHTFSLQPVLAGYQEVMNASKVAWGNLTSRIRMNLLYLYANDHHLLVSGTSNKTEWYTGYFTKYGDNAADVQPIIHLLKDDVYTIASYLQVPSVFIEKIPSAGLYEGQTDEADLQMSYATLNAALRSLEQHNWIAETEDETRVMELYQSSLHKRLSPPQISHFTNLSENGGSLHR